MKETTYVHGLARGEGVTKCCGRPILEVAHIAPVNAPAGYVTCPGPVNLGPPELPAPRSSWNVSRDRVWRVA